MPTIGNGVAQTERSLSTLMFLALVVLPSRVRATAPTATLCDHLAALVIQRIDAEGIGRPDASIVVRRPIESNSDMPNKKLFSAPRCLRNRVCAACTIRTRHQPVSCRSR
jgi:hypothetical protein